MAENMRAGGQTEALEGMLKLVPIGRYGRAEESPTRCSGSAVTAPASSSANPSRWTADSPCDEGTGAMSNLARKGNAMRDEDREARLDALRNTSQPARCPQSLGRLWSRRRWFRAKSLQRRAARRPPRLPAARWVGRATAATRPARSTPALAQIDRDTFSRLRVAWTWQSVEADVVQANPGLRTWAWESTPLMVDGVLYVSTSLSQSGGGRRRDRQDEVGLRP